MIWTDSIYQRQFWESEIDGSREGLFMRRIIWLAPMVLIAAGLFAADLNEELLNASRKGDLAAVKQLVEKGASIEAKTAYGQTPLYVAAMNNHEDVVRFLLEKGARTDITDTFYKAPLLDFVASRQHFGMIKLLLQKGANAPEAMLVDLLGSGDPGLVQVILDNKKPSQASIDSAYEHALQSKQTEAAALLKKAGANEPAPAVQVDPAILQSYAGTYKSPSVPLDIKAFVKDGTLFMQATGQGEFPLKPKSPTLFEFSAAKIVVEFDSPSSFTLKQGGIVNYQFKKAVTQ
jgi:ankyrin repeat protein